MSKSYFVITTLGIEYCETNIKKIIRKGSEIGFIYYDFIMGEQYQDSPLLSYEKAFERVINMKKKPDEDDSLFFKISMKHFAHLWFYKTEEGYLEYYLGSFSYIKEKKFENSHTTIDFKFYIEVALQLGNDFGIEKLNADHMD